MPYWSDREASVLNDPRPSILEGSLRRGGQAGVRNLNRVLGSGLLAEEVFVVDVVADLQRRLATGDRAGRRATGRRRVLADADPEGERADFDHVAVFELHFALDQEPAVEDGAVPAAVVAQE